MYQDTKCLEWETFVFFYGPIFQPPYMAMGVGGKVLCTKGASEVWRARGGVFGWGGGLRCMLEGIIRYR